MTSTKDIVSTAESAGQFTTLVTDVATMMTARTVNGQSVAISVNGSTVKIDDATVVKANVA